MTTDAYDDDEYDDDGNPIVQPPTRQGRNWKQLREKAEKELPAALTRAEQAEAERDALKREIAFNKAGIDLDTPMGKLFADAYKGDPTIEAVTTAAQGYGVIESKSDVPGDEQQALQNIRNAPTGAGVAGKSQITPAQAGQWDRRQWQRFAKEHPDMADQLKRGQPVSAVPGF